MVQLPLPMSIRVPTELSTSFVGNLERLQGSFTSLSNNPTGFDFSGKSSSNIPVTPPGQSYRPNSAPGFELLPAEPVAVLSAEIPTTVSVTPVTETSTSPVLSLSSVQIKNFSLDAKVEDVPWQAVKNALLILTTFDLKEAIAQLPASELNLPTIQEVRFYASEVAKALENGATKIVKSGEVDIDFNPDQAILGDSFD